MEQLPAELIDNICYFLVEFTDIVRLATTSHSMLETFQCGVRLHHMVAPKAALATSLQPIYYSANVPAEEHDLALYDYVGKLRLVVTRAVAPITVRDHVREIAVVAGVPMEDLVIRQPIVVRCGANITSLACGILPTQLRFTNIPAHLNQVKTSDVCCMVWDKSAHYIQSYEGLLSQGSTDYPDYITLKEARFMVVRGANITLPPVTALGLVAVSQLMYLYNEPQIRLQNVPDQIIIHWGLLQYLKLPNDKPVKKLRIIDNGVCWPAIKEDTPANYTVMPQGDELISKIPHCVRYKITANTTMPLLLLPLSRYIFIDFVPSRPMLAVHYGVPKSFATNCSYVWLASPNPTEERLAVILLPDES